MTKNLLIFIPTSDILFLEFGLFFTKGDKIMKRFFACVLLFALLALTVSGCGSNGTSKGPSCADILNSVKDATEDGFDKVYTYEDSEYQDNFSHMYAVMWDMIDDGGILYTEKGGLADEISLMHIKDQGDISIAKEKLQERIEERRNQFNGYKPEEVYKLDNATVIVQGNYIALLIGEDPAMLEVEIRNAISNLSE